MITTGSCILCETQHNIKHLYNRVVRSTNLSSAKNGGASVVPRRLHKTLKSVLTLEPECSLTNSFILLSWSEDSAENAIAIGQSLSFGAEAAHFLEEPERARQLMYTLNSRNIFLSDILII